MKNTIKSLMIGGSLLAAATTAQAEVELEVEVHAGYHSIYEFRGVDFGDDLIETGVDFSTDLAEGLSLSGGIWYADTTDSSLEEVDFYVGLTKTIGKVDVSVGYTYYAFPGATASNTDEVYIGLATEFENGLGLSLTYYEDIDVIDGGYLEFEATKSYELCACVNLDLAVGAAWSFDYNADVDGTPLDGFNHYYVSVAAPWAISEKMTLTPYVKFVGAASDLNNEFGATDSEDLFLGGVTLSYSF